ncbi:MAG: NDP-hexose 2,3-dehydratase family protein [Patescibacteria group bacterium]|nr:NDP-hexose 2,3-dehydratase family protein [Patescibacteria group bacterium]
MKKKENWRDWLRKLKMLSTMSVKQISLKEVKGWGMQKDGEYYGRSDEKFFKIIGVEISAGEEEREMKKWSQPILQEWGVGIVVLIKVRNLFLISAKAEPGNMMAGGRIFLAPSIQCSESNLSQVHGGKKTPRVDLLDGLKKIRWHLFPQDGGRYYGKNNKYAVVNVEKVAKLENERLFSVEELKEAFLDGCCNEHLSQVFLLYLMTQ